MKIAIRGVDIALRHVMDAQGRLAGRVKELLFRLGQFGVDMASVRFKTAQYDGVNDVTVGMEWTDDKTLTIRADGGAVAFIEFGTGVHYKEAHPKASEFGAVRGSYGHGLGKLDSWRYTGNPGTNGEIITEGKHAGMVRTHGNPPARAMYDTGRGLREQIVQIAREVFG